MGEANTFDWFVKMTQKKKQERNVLEMKALAKNIDKGIIKISFVTANGLRHLPKIAGFDHQLANFLDNIKK